MRTSRWNPSSVAALAAALALAACSDTNGPGTPALTSVQADEVAQVVSVDADLLTEGTIYSTAPVPFPAPGPSRSPPACTPTRSPATPANSDGDPVPDSVRLDFAGCVFSTPFETISLSGTIDIIDPTPAATDYAVKSVFTDFTRSRTEMITGKTRSSKENGTRQVSGSASVLQHSLTNFRTDYTFDDGSTAAHVKTWSTTFTADVPGSIRRDSLPNGTWDIAGTSTWTRGTNTFSLSVTTNPALHYNAGCARAPRFDAGKLIVEATRGSSTSTVTIEYTACGQYTVTKS